MYTIKELADLAGVTPKALRVYEEKNCYSLLSAPKLVIGCMMHPVYTP